MPNDSRQLRYSVTLAGPHFRRASTAGRCLVFATIALSLASCAPYSKVSTRTPRFTPAPKSDPAQLEAYRLVREGLRNERRKPTEAIAGYLRVAETANRQLAEDPTDPQARHTYNFAVARIIATIQKGKLDPWSKPLVVPSEGGDFILSHKRDPRPQRDPALYDFTPADEFDVGGSYVRSRDIKEGVGAPLVAIGKEVRTQFRDDFSIPRVYYGITAVIHFSKDRRGVIAFEDPLEKETIRFNGRETALGADFTVPLAVLLAREDPKKMELSRMLRPEKYAETARIARLQPYDPNKTVVLCLHGLMDSPATWAPMLNSLRNDPGIRKNYQFWFYSYPSGYPYPYSASILRRELDAVQKRFPLSKKMVLVGHSMGGCISRLMITDTGDLVWRELFGKSPAETHLPEKSHELLTESLIFEHRPEVGRVVFIAAPLRGSDLASHWVGRFGSMLVKAPVKLIGVGRDVLKVATFRADELRLKRIPNSVDTLAPNNRFVRAINKIPIRRDVPYHVICGDRGKGGNKDKTSPTMSDGIVPYWSSRLEHAESELIVASNHSAHQNPDTIEEVRRILKEHANR